MSVTTTTTKSYGKRLMNSVFWVLIWLWLFIGSFFVLFTNEWRVDLSTIATLSIQSEQWVNYEWQFISKSWNIGSEEKVWDGEFIKEWDYIFIERTTEMYSWVENSESKTKENIWGSETTTTTYTYEKKWKEKVENSNSFQKKAWHNNPIKKIKSLDKSVNNAYIENYTFSLNWLRLPKWIPLLIKEDIRVNDIYSYTNNFIFVGWWSLEQPNIWDIRISYKIFNKDTFGTIFWKVNGNKIVKYNHDEKSSIFHLFDLDREGSINELHDEYVFKLWMFRGIWFLMMWVWLNLIMWLFTTLLAVIPLLAKAWRFLISVITFLTAVVLSFVTIIVGIIAHNVYILIWVIVLILILVFIYFKKYKNIWDKSMHEVREDKYKEEDERNKGY